MKCCPVPSPADKCSPSEQLISIRSCKNDLGIYPRRCDFEFNLGVTYDYGHLRSINFHESVGHSLEAGVENLKRNFKRNAASSGLKRFTWTDDEQDERVWSPDPKGEWLHRALYLQVNTTSDIFQVVGLCGHFIVRTNRFLQIVTDTQSQNQTRDYFEI